MVTTDSLLFQAAEALDGKHPQHGFPIDNGTQEATAHALVALAIEQQTTNELLARIANALDRQTAAPAAAEPPRRRWFSGRRNAIHHSA